VARVSFTANLRRHRSVPDVRAEGGSVREVLERVFAGDPLLRSYVLDDQGRVRRHVNIFLNGDMIRDRQHLSDAAGAQDEIYVMQALSGG